MAACVFALVMVLTLVASPGAEGTGFSLAPGITLNVGDITPDQVANGTERAGILELNFTNGGSWDTLTDLSVTSNCTNDGDVTAVRLIADDGDGEYEPWSDDTIVDSVAGFTAGVAAFTGLSVNITAGNTLLFVAFDISSGAAGGNVIDGYIDAGGVTLQNGGTSTAKEDPAGFSTVKEVVGGGLYTPYIIYGFIYHEDGSTVAAGNTVWVNNTNTGQGQVTVTDLSGRYSVDAADFVGGYTDNDNITVEADSTAQYRSNYSHVNTSGVPSLQIDVYLANRPASSSSIYPDYNNTGAWTVTYTTSDPAVSSGIDYVELWFSYEGGAYHLFATDTLVTGSFNFNNVSAGNGNYSFYTLAYDNYGLGEPVPSTADDLVTFDNTTPVVNPAVADKHYVNNAGTGGTPIPVNITTTWSDVNPYIASVGVRGNNNTAPNSTYFVSFNATTSGYTNRWNATWFFIDGAVVTPTLDRAKYGTDIQVFGDLNGNHSVDDIIGKNLPQYYALFDLNGVIQNIYNTQGTPFADDDTVAGLSALDTFWAYRYDGNDGYVVSVGHSDTTTLALLEKPIAEGNYTYVFTAMDQAGNYDWANETAGTGWTVVDDTAPVSDCFIAPDVNNTGSWTVTYNATDPGAGHEVSGLANVSLYLVYENVTYWVMSDLGTAIDGVFVYNNVSFGEGWYDFYTVATDYTGNTEALPATVDDSILYDGTDPAVQPSVVDKHYVNNAGTGGTPIPVNITTAWNDANPYLGGLGVRRNNATGNDTYFVTFNATTSGYVNQWNATWFHIDGKLVTPNLDRPIYGTDIVVFGDLNGTHAVGDIFGKNVPPYYALFDVNGVIQQIYATQGTTDVNDDTPMGLNPPDTFWAYYYDGGDGYIIAVEHSDPTSLALAESPAPEGNYTFVTTVADRASNTNWTNEEEGAGWTVVDNTLPQWTLEYAISNDVDGDGIIDRGDTIDFWLNVTDANPGIAGYISVNVDETVGGAPSANNAVSSLNVSGSGATWTFSYTIAGDNFTTSDVDVLLYDLAMNGNNRTENFTVTLVQGSRVIPFVQGWNLISVPVANPRWDNGGMEDLDVAADFEGMAGARMVSRWDADTQRYVSYIVGFHNAGDAENFAIDTNEGYFVWFDGPYNLTVYGSLPGARTIPVVPGWNLLAWNNPFAGDAGTDIADDVTANGLDHIAGYNVALDDFSDAYIFPADTLVLTPGRGYFVWSDVSATVEY